ncbi:unnamed protein product [Calicophoron daubneyi]|uniref:Uncharacterized protein n=1 Tax=Calicophoron daubneyi TaxID=300641 RepID=A0AAV2TY62_CALDB
MIKTLKITLGFILIAFLWIQATRTQATNTATNETKTSNPSETAATTENPVTTVIASTASELPATTTKPDTTVTASKASETSGSSSASTRSEGTTPTTEGGTENLTLSPALVVFFTTVTWHFF